jgi:hypothetical protein
MMKALIKIEDRNTVLIGLSFGNLRKFLAEPRDTFIKLDGKQMQLPVDILIFSGETEAHMLDMMKAHIGPDTIMHIGKNIKN